MIEEKFEKIVVVVVLVQQSDRTTAKARAPEKGKATKTLALAGMPASSRDVDNTRDTNKIRNVVNSRKDRNVGNTSDKGEVVKSSNGGSNTVSETLATAGHQGRQQQQEYRQQAGRQQHKRKLKHQKASTTAGMKESV
jgi:hypothetical protein